MDVVEKNLTAEQFTRFYYNFIWSMDKVGLAEWIIRILPEDELDKMLNSSIPIRHDYESNQEALQLTCRHGIGKKHHCARCAMENDYR